MNRTFLFPNLTQPWHFETFEITPVERDSYTIGDIISFGTGERLQIVEMGRRTLTVRPAPTERQETLARLTGRSPDEFIP